MYPTFAFRYPIIMMMNNVEITNAVTLNATMYQFGFSRTITSANRDDDPPIVQSLWYCFPISKAGWGNAYKLEDPQVFWQVNKRQFSFKKQYLSYTLNATVTFIQQKYLPTNLIYFIGVCKISVSFTFRYFLLAMKKDNRLRADFYRWSKAELTI